MNLMKAIVAASVLCLSSGSFAKTLKVNSKRLIKVIGVVQQDAINQAQELEKLTRKSKAPVYLLINSPGGAVIPGLIFVEAMKQAKARGVEIKCVTGVLAASMAFIYLAHCDERYVLDNARLLFHPVSVGMSRARVQELVVDLDQIVKEEREIMQFLQSSMDLKWKDFHRHYFAETFWTARGLDTHLDENGWLTLVDDVTGVGDDLYKWRKPRMFLFGKRKQNAGNGNVDRIIKRFLGED